MPKPRPLQPADLAAFADRLDGLDGEKEELRQLTREAHEAAADVRDATAALRSAVAEWHQLLNTDIGDQVRAVIEGEVRAGLAHYKDTLATQVKAGEDALMRRYDRLIMALFGDETDHPMEELMGSFKQRQDRIEAAVDSLLRHVGLPTIRP